MRDASGTTPAFTARGASFDEVVLPHLEAARRLARWLLRSDSDADDAVQEASLRALRYFDSFAGGNARAWFLRIVRNTCHHWNARQSRHDADLFDEVLHGEATASVDPETLLLQRDAHALVERALGDLPRRARALLVRRELEGLTYQELSDVMGVPIGTVMSGLSRARRALRVAVEHELRPAQWPSSARLSERERSVA